MLALLFPGQGSQEVGMGRDIARASSAAQQVFEAADDALGFSLSKLCFEGPEEKLRPTEVQQPAILTTSIALLRALEEVHPIAPDFVAGHSLGEYSALVAAGGLPFEEAVRLVHARGRFMQEAVPEGRGAMAAILGCGPEVVTKACAQAASEAGAVATPANFNSPQQTVISGDATAVELACTKAVELGASRAVPLAVSAPFHCSLMQPAADKLQLELERVPFSDLSAPLVSNVEAEPNSDGARARQLLKSQVTEPVRFTEMVEKLLEVGVSRFLEIGPGRVLVGLVRRISRKTERASLRCLDDLEKARSFAAGESLG
jgi:[acyl-carrier-protein] S-malonyltransferase